jgi:pimeloyl-ACP methyl ester carboxylesterase
MHSRRTRPIRNAKRTSAVAMFAVIPAVIIALVSFTAPPSLADDDRQNSLKDNSSDNSKDNSGDDGRDQGKDNGEDDRDNDEKENDNRIVDRTCATDKTRQYSMDPARLPFDALAGVTTTTDRKWGILKDAGYRIEIPTNWNGELVIWAHGFAGWDCDLNVDNPPMRRYLIENGYAWAASSYSKNGYVVQQGVDDSVQLIKQFKREVKKPRRTYMTGASMGGHITGVAIEQHRKKFDGAMPVCGVMGSESLFDYFLDFNELAQSISGVQSPYPYGVDYVPTIVPTIKAALAADPSKSSALAAAVMQRSGGTRVGFGISVAFWFDFLYGLGQPNPGVVPAFGASNFGTSYQLDNDPAVTPAEAALNSGVRRVSRLDYPTPDGVVPVPRINGSFKIPVLTLHTTGDLFVPFSMEQLYAQRAAAKGNSNRLVQRAIRDVGHCTFSEAEFNTAFQDLAAWVHNGIKPAGDDVLTPSVVASPTYGCTFTKTAGAFQGTAFRPLYGPC